MPTSWLSRCSVNFVASCWNEPASTVFWLITRLTVSVTDLVLLKLSVSVEVPRGVRVHALCPDGVQTAMLDAQDKTAIGSQLVHSGGRILTVDETADAAVALLGTRRVVRSLPRWRGAVVRTSTLAPSIGRPAARLFAARGRRLIARRAR